MTKVHDRILSNLERIVTDEISCRNLEYSNSIRTIGEIDYFVYNTKTEILRLFEVKSTMNNKSFEKAIIQLKRHKDIWVPEYFQYTPKIIQPYIVSKSGTRNYTPKIYYIYDLNACVLSDFISTLP